ncbi:MAG: HEAT repeat domain-containing protein [Planctomycetia bacterium]|nr:HEAT repeat domain-containing protein [Planctomycetia bacterium]
MYWIAALALTLGGPFGFPMWEWNPSLFIGLTSSGGWTGQAYDFHQFLPPAINAQHRLSPGEQWYVSIFFRDTRGSWELRREIPRREVSALPPPLSVLRPTGQQERTGSLLLSDEAAPRVPGWKMLHVDVAEGDHLLLDLAAADERVRLASVRRLGQLKLRCAVGALTATLRDDPSGVVREAAVRALTVIGDTGALFALQEAADADPDAQVRRTALFAVEVLEAHATPAVPEAPATSEQLWRWGPTGFFN